MLMKYTAQLSGILLYYIKCIQQNMRSWWRSSADGNHRCTGKKPIIIRAAYLEFHLCHMVVQYRTQIRMFVWHCRSSNDALHACICLSNTLKSVDCIFTHRYLGCTKVSTIFSNGIMHIVGSYATASWRYTPKNDNVCQKCLGKIIDWNHRLEPYQQKLCAIGPDHTIKPVS